MRRRGFTLVELLVATGIVAILLGLTLAGVQRVRMAAARTTCADNVRQLALGLHNYHSAHGRLPPGIRGSRDRYPYMTWGARLLPYLEQSAAWAEAVEDYERQPRFTSPVPHRNLARPLLVFLCPADGRRVGTNEEGTTAAFNFYLGVSASFSQQRDGMLFRDSDVRLADVTDGTSQTLVLGERPPSADAYFGWWYAGIGQNELDGSADSVMAVRELNRTFRAPTCHRGPYHFNPGTSDNLCSMFHFWSQHPGGAHFAFADGSVQFFRYDIDPLLPALATRAGGESVALTD